MAKWAAFFAICQAAQISIPSGLFCSKMCIVIPISEALELRQRQAEDEAELFILTDFNRAYLKQWLPWLDGCVSAEDTLKKIALSMGEAADGTGFGVTIREMGKIVGVAGFHTIDKDRRTGEIGYWLGKEFQGRGIMTRAVRALTGFGFTQLGLQRVTITTAIANLASRAIAEKLGFRLEDICKEVDWQDGQRVDYVMYAIEYSEWKVLPSGVGG